MGGKLQDKLYSKILRSGDGVKENIQNAVFQISPAQLRRVMISRFVYETRVCQPKETIHSSLFQYSKLNKNITKETTREAQTQMGG